MCHILSILFALDVQTIRGKVIIEGSLNVDDQLHFDDSTGKLIISTLSSAEDVCEDGWTHFLENNANVCYKFFSMKMGFKDAEEHCNGIGSNGHLVSISNVETNERIGRLALNEEIWLGGERWSGSKDFRWVDGSGTTATYSNWQEIIIINLKKFVWALRLSYFSFIIVGEMESLKRWETKSV